MKKRMPSTAFGIILFSYLLVSALMAESHTPLDAPGIIAKYPDRAEMLLEQIDMDYPGLERCKNAFNAEDHSTALALLLSYMREKDVPTKLAPELPPPRPDIIALADDATQGIYTIQSQTYTQPRLPDGHINWEDRGPKGDKEWAWMLNRHPHFEFLVTAFRWTQNPRYLETISEHLIDWIPNHRPPDRVSFSTSWRALEAARRIMDSWMDVYVYERSNPAFSDEALFLTLCAIPEHAHYLRDHYSFWGGNHKVTEKMAIAMCALAWPEFKESRSWLKTSLNVISQELFLQTYPDGAYKELANHYQKVVAQNYLRIMQMLEGNQLLEIDPEFRARVEALWDYFAYVARPSGYGPLNSDSSREDNFTYLEEANEFFHQSDWTYILTHGISGTAPQEPPSRFYPWAGHAIMRNGWGPDAQWAFFDIGPHGSAHQHWDRLHLSVTIGQQDLLVDSGRYTYKPSPMREYFRYGVGHNLVRVDNQDSRRPPNTIKAPMNVFSQMKDAFDAFGASVRFDLGLLKTSHVDHHRWVVYLRDKGWLVIDELVGFGDHQYDTIWNFHPDCSVSENAGTLEASVNSKPFANLTLLNPPPNGTWDLVKGQTAPEIRGWYSWAYNEKRPDYSARFRYRTTQPRINIWWISPAQSPGNTPSISGPGNPKSMKDLEIRIQNSNETLQLKWTGSEFALEKLPE